MAAGLGLLFLLNALGQRQQGIPRQGGAAVGPTESTSPFQQVGPTPQQPTRPRLSFEFNPTQLPAGQSNSKSNKYTRLHSINR